MNNRFIVTALFALCFFACKNQDKKNNEDQSPAITIVKEKQQLTDPVFFATLEGNIGNQPVVMHIMKSGNRIDANYYYTQQGQPIFLTKNWQKESKDSIYLLDITSRDNDESNSLALLFYADSATGTWFSGDQKKTHPIHLKRSNPNSALNFIASSVVDSSQYLKLETDTPMLKTAVTVLAAADTSGAANWLNDRFKAIIGNGDSRFATLSLPQTAAALVKEQVDGYEAEADSSMVGLKKEGPHFFLNREYEKLSNLIYNQNGYVVVSFFNYAYTGGAHGNYGTSAHCFDLSSKKQLALSDIMSIDSLQMQQLLEKNYRKQYNLPATTPIEERLFVKHLLPNDNFYFSSAGLGFIYTPYEIAPYASGEINIWIPFAELKPNLHPAFVNRMHL